MKDRPESETWLVAGKVLNKTIQACMANLHSYSRNAVCRKTKEVPGAPGVVHFSPMRRVGIEG